MIYIFFAIFAGISVTLQNSINGLMTPIVGSTSASFAGFTIQTLFLVAYLLIKEHRMPFLKKAPLPYYLNGLLAVVVVGAIGICVSRMGSAVTTCCSVAGQIIMSAFVDHFGLFGTQKTRFSRNRIPGFLLILAGVFAINLIGNKTTEDMTLGLLFFAISLGACAIVVRTLNVKVSEIVGSSIDSGIINSVGGSVGGLILLLALSNFKPDFAAFTHVPLLYYSAGFFGAVCLLLNINAYKKLDVFYATIFMLIGQVATGILIDILVFHSLSVGKCIGIAIIMAGILLDKILLRKK